LEQNQERAIRPDIGHVRGMLEEADPLEAKGREGESCAKSLLTFPLISLAPPNFQESRVIIDMDELDLVPKDVRPLDVQTPNESRNLWSSVTQQILGKNWGEATREKQVIEQVSCVHRV
jgi:hypothetical protein